MQLLVVVFTSEVQNSAIRLITEVLVPRCARGTMRLPPNVQHALRPMAPKCHPSGGLRGQVRNLHTTPISPLA